MIGGLIAMIRGSYHLTVDRRAMAGQSPLPPDAGYGAAGFAAPGSTAPGSTAPGYLAPGYAAPGYAAPGFAPAPALTPQGGAGAPKPGWFADPQDPATLRWWDGQAWTARTQPTVHAQPAGPGYPAGSAH